ncbi:MAG: hypothetical protein IT428_33615 [Planctomycetaceae bacterium]|nr:hypothetical protein [Planctomycetaceae bacterium]
MSSEFRISVPTYDPESDYDHSRLVPVQIDDGQLGVRVAMLSRSNPDGSPSLEHSPEVFIERRGASWVVMIAQEGGNDPHLFVHVPDDLAEPIRAERSHYSAPLEFSDRM